MLQCLVVGVSGICAFESGLERKTDECNVENCFLEADVNRFCSITKKANVHGTGENELVIFPPREKSKFVCAPKTE